MNLDDLLGGHVQFIGQFFWSGLTTQVLQQLALNARELVDDLHHVNRDSNCAGLIGHRASDGLTDPPRRIGRKLEPLGVVKLLDGANQSEVALLNEVKELHPAPGVPFGQRYDEAKVRLKKVTLGAFTIVRDDSEFTTLTALLFCAGHLGPFFLGEQSRFDPQSERDLLFGVEKSDLTDLLEVVLDRVRGCSGDLVCNGLNFVITR